MNKEKPQRIISAEAKESLYGSVYCDSIATKTKENMTKAEEYSFNIESSLFQQLTKEQQALWRKEIEQAYNAGAKWQEQKDTELLQEAGIVIVPEDHFERMKRSLIQLASQIKNLWKPADGDDLPEIDKEVIVLVGIKKPVTTDSMWGCEVAFAHRPNPDGWDGKSITTGKVEHYDVQTYDKGGWNIPDVKFWLDCNMDSIFKRNNENNKIDKR